MTRSYDEYRQIMELWESGLKNKKAITRLTGIPRATVRDCIERFETLAQLEAEAAEHVEPTLLRVLKRELPGNLIHEKYAYVLGIYLGDGNISKVRDVYRLRVSLDARYPNIISRCKEALETLLPDNKASLVEIYYKGRVSHIDVSMFYKRWIDLLPQHGAGKKHTRSIQLHDWQERIVAAYPLEFFRGLYHSDGSRINNRVNGKVYPRYQFTNTSPDIVKLFCDTCDLLNLHWTEKTRPTSTEFSAKDVYISRRKDVEYLDSVIGPKN